MYLRWFRDKGRGQEASNAVNAREDFDGAWPIAMWQGDREQCEAMWKYLYTTFDVNPTNYANKYSKVEVEVRSDFDGYFERLVRDLIAQKRDYYVRKVIITSGPWRSYGVKFEKLDGDVLHLDFYSALRNGFGQLDPNDLLSVL